MKKKALAAVLVAAVTMSMAGCGSKQAASTDGGSKTESEAGSDAAAADSGEKKTLRVGMECAYAPYNWTQSDDSNGAVPISGSSDYAYGYDVMMAKHICEELGWDLEDNREIFSLDELIKEFDYHRINKSPSVFDYMKLKWMNGEYIKAMADEAFYTMAEPYLKSVIKKDLDLHKIAAMVKTRIEVFPDICDLIDFFETLPEYDPEMYTHKKMKTNKETSLAVLQELCPVFEQQEDYSNDALYQLLTTFAAEHEYKNGYVLWPVRTAVSGKQMTPAGATEIMEILGKEESINRIRKGIELLQNAAAK